MKKIGFVGFVLAAFMVLGVTPVCADPITGTHETVYTPDADGNFGLTHTCSYSDGEVYTYTISANSKTPEEGTVLTVTQSKPMEGTTTSFCALSEDVDNDFRIDYDHVYNLGSSGSFTLTSVYAQNGLGVWPRADENGFCDFLHWNKDGSIKSLYSDLEVDADGNVVEKEKKTVYTLSYNLNAEDARSVFPVDHFEVEEGEVVTVMDGLLLIRDGYELDSWNTKADGTGTSYKAGDTFVMTGDLVLYAIWAEKDIPLYTNTEFKVKIEAKNTMLEAYTRKNPDVTIKKVKFKSSDKKTAKVNKAGVITGGKKTGVATVTMFIKSVTTVTNSKGKSKKKVSKWTEANTMSVYNKGINKKK